MNFDNILSQETEHKNDIDNTTQHEQLADLTLKYFISFGGTEELY